MPSAPTPSAVSEYLSAIGREGGKTKGKQKKRSKAHYRRIGKMGADARARNAKKCFAKAVKDYEAEHGKPERHAR